MPKWSKPCCSAGGWMGERPRIDLYCEDSGHEQFARALLTRIAQELGVRLTIQTASGRGGHGRALSEFQAWQRAVATGGGIGYDIPDFLEVLGYPCPADPGKCERDIYKRLLRQPW